MIPLNLVFQGHIIIRFLVRRANHRSISMDIRSKSDLEKLLEDLKKIVDLDNIVCTN